MAAASTSILKYFKPVCRVRSSSSSTTQTLPDLDGQLSERVPAKAQLPPIGHRKLYVYESPVYCTFTKEFTSGHGLMCAIMVMLGSPYSLQCFESCFNIWCTLIRQSFTPSPPLALGDLNFCLISQVSDSPKFFRQCNVFADLPKFYTTNVLRYTVYF